VLLAQLVLIPRLHLKNKTLMWVGCIPLLMGAVLMIFANNYAALILSQFMIGLGQGLARPGFSSGASLAAGWSKAMVFPVAPAATAEDPATPAGARDPQPESVSPRSWHFGQFLGEPAILGGTAPIAGAVVDEWAEQRPSALQPAAIAVNYNTPQNEAPNAILLAIPPDAQQVFWTPELAAQMVGETIAWMQVRAIPSDLRAASWTVLPNSNRVPLKPGRPGKRRVPVRTLKLSFADMERQQGLFVVSPRLDAAARTVADAVIAERDFGSKLKE
jgi:hypothetical protein